jgi:hypothetical protein
MRRLLAAILALSALYVGAGPRPISWTLPTEYDDAILATATTPAVPATPLPASNIIGHNIYFYGTGTLPIEEGRPTGFQSTGSGAPTAIINIDRPTWVRIEAVAIQPGGDPTLGGFASAKSPAVLIVPKLRPKAVVSPAASDAKATECLPAGRVCALP